MKRWKNLFIGLGAAVFFTAFYAAGLFEPLEERLYDGFLRFRAQRERFNEVVFLDVDDDAIAYNGVFPWPRSVTAEGLLRLKEFGVRSAIFDIEFIDKGPAGVDTLYLEQGLYADFIRSFSGLNSAAQDLFSALKAGRIKQGNLDEYAGEFSALIGGEREALYRRAQGVARDNDLFLIRSSALFGKSWGTLNLRSEALEGEQAERRSIAEERFSYPVDASSGAARGDYADILPPLPGFARSLEGAGFTNVEIDGDGIRRRISLARNIHGHWYLQLAFAPLVHHLGNPGIELSRSRLVMRNARLPGGTAKDIVIPLDSRGRMMLDWPREDYRNSYRHISFAEFSLLDDIEAEMEKLSRGLGETDLSFFIQFDSSLAPVTGILSRLEAVFDAVHTAKNDALEQCSEESFNGYVELRAQSRALIRSLLDLKAPEKIASLLPRLAEAFPQNAEAVADEAAYIASLLEYLAVDADAWEERSGNIQREVRDKFCILGRVDTGTTDIGANPFWGEYVNVGTHAVVLDTILSESFLLPLGIFWRIFFTLLFVPLFLFASAGLPPGPRTAAGFGTAILLAAAALLLFRWAGIFFGPLGTLLALTSAVIIREIISYAGSEREKQFIRKAFSTYVSGDVVREIIGDPSRLQLGGTKRHMSAVFTDVRGFSTISEQLDPEDLVRLLNCYLTAMSDAVLAEKGTIDKYEGDAIIAFFGAPLEQPDHALRACLSACAMKRIERELNKTILEQKWSPAPLLTRIGINTGSMVAGNMGTDNKMNYTIMGNAVNLAARLEGVNKQYGTWILASENTICETGGRLLVRKLDRVRVVGINEAVRLYEILDTVDGASDAAKKTAALFEEALGLFESRNWKAAEEAFRSVLAEENGGPAEKYLERCGQFIKKAPADDWDGVFSLTEK